MKANNIHVHGDVILERIDKLPNKKLKKKKNLIVREGEFSGHAHRLSGGTILLDREQMFLEIVEKTKISHEEHKTIEIEPGIYKVRDEVEYDYFTEQIEEVQD